MLETIYVCEAKDEFYEKMIAGRKPGFRFRPVEKSFYWFIDDMRRMVKKGDNKIMIDYPVYIETEEDVEKAIQWVDEVAAM